MTELAFTVLGDAVGKMRHRSRVSRLAGGKAFVQTYSPAPTVSYEKAIFQAAALAHRGRPRIDGPVELGLRVFVAMPKGFSRKKQAAALAGEVWPLAKPDLDNILKSVLDALCKKPKTPPGLRSLPIEMDTRIIADDCRVVRISHLEKTYDRAPRIEVTLRELGPPA